MPPTPPTDAFAQAADCLARGDLAGAERHAMALLAGAPDHADGLQVLGLARARQGRLPEALALLDRAMISAPGQPYLMLNLAKLRDAAGQHEQAARLLEDVVRLKPGLSEAWLELGDQQRQLNRMAEAEASYRRGLALEPSHGAAKIALGAVLLAQGRPADAERMSNRGLDEPHPAPLKTQLAQNLAIAQMQQNKKDAALQSIVLVQRLDPARVEMDATRAALLTELGRFDEALGVMEVMLARNPADAALHRRYNDLLHELGRDDKLLTSYDRAPPTTPLQMGKGIFLLTAERGEEAHAVFAGILRREPDNLDAAVSAAAALDLMGRPDEALALLEPMLARQADPRLEAGIAIAALKAHDPAKAAAMAQRILALLPHEQTALARLSTAWRMLDDPREDALSGYDDLVRVFDLEPPDGFSDRTAFNTELAGALEILHPGTREFLGQSLRGGTQTRGNLFGAGHNLVERLRTRIEDSVTRYIAELAPDPAHPFRGRRGAGFAFAGSWSSRLADCGFHVNHIHHKGWISSCYYAGVPDAVADETAKQGWIKFGEPNFDAGLSFRRAIQPKPGRLVLFPSYLWHGTIPFHSAQKRTTIAFDVIPA